ncbi:hypothetical protein EAN86_07140 [Klebsiella pneumoniae]|nr:hypothetical protein EAN86_07140 [Klebsiella pneumoniae]
MGRNDLLIRTFLSEDDKSFIKTVDDERMKAEAERRGYQKKMEAEKEREKPKPLSEKILLQNDVIFACKDIARNSLTILTPSKLKILIAG